VLLDDRDARVRADAVIAIGQSGADSFFAEHNLLDRFTSERNRIVRRRYLEAFGKIGGHTVLKALLAPDLDRSLRSDLALAFARFGMRGIHADEAVALLAGWLRSDEPDLRRNAAYWFGRITDTEPWEAVADGVRAALDSYAPDDEAAMQLLLGLGRLEDPADLERFVHWLSWAADWRIRANAARTLGGLASHPEASGALLDGLDDSSVHVAVNCAGALARVDAPARAEIARIREWIESHDEPWQVTVALLPVLVGAGEGAFVRSWIEALPVSRSLPRSRGLAALAQAPGREVFTFLVEAARSADSRIAAAAVDALSRRWRRERAGGADPRPFYDVFAGALAGRDLAAAFTAARVLADSLFRPLGSIDLLIGTWRVMAVPDEVEPMTAVLGALGRIGGSTVERFLREVARDPAHPVLGQGAVAALTEMGVEGVTTRAAVEETEPVLIDWQYLVEKGPAPRLRLETEKGEVVVRLLAEEAPLTVQTILRFAEAGSYDGIAFHRVVPNFVIQGGDFERQDGMGGPGFVIRSEFTRIPYGRGVIGMASAGKDTEGSQYFITHSMQPHLDGRYTAFGHVISGMEVVDSILEGDRVIRATIHP
jgi:peptidylprolyl isomerase